MRKMTPGGPVLARSRARRQQLRSSTFRPILSPGDRILIAIMSICWLVCLVDFWVWWLEPVHRTSLIGLVINSVVLAYVSCYPVFFVVAANRLRNVSQSVAVPLLRTAFVVTRAPSEPWDVARSTLIAMLESGLPAALRRLALRRTAPAWRSSTGARNTAWSWPPATARRIITADLATADQVQGRQPGLLLRPLGLPQLRRCRPA